MPCSIPPSQLAAFVASLLGQLEGKVMARVLSEVQKIIAKLRGNICPPVEELKKIIKVRDNLTNAINAVEKKVEPIKKFADILDPPIKAGKATVLVLEQIPIPTSIGTPPIGGTADIGGQLSSISIGAQNRFAQLLNLACQLLELLQRDQQAIKDLVSISTVDSLNEEILAEIENLPSNAGITDQTGENTYDYFKGDRKYTIRIIVDENSPGFAKKRFAIVENFEGVTVLRGPSSFSSSTKVLIDEIKFRINNQLP